MNVLIFSAFITLQIYIWRYFCGHVRTEKKSCDFFTLLILIA